jgi:hypothetical protein
MKSEIVVGTDTNGKKKDGRFKAAGHLAQFLGQRSYNTRCGKRI